MSARHDEPFAASTDPITGCTRMMIGIGAAAVCFLALVLLSAVRPARRETGAAAATAAGLGAAIVIPGLLEQGPAVFVPFVFP